MIWLLPVFGAILLMDIHQRAATYNIFFASDGVLGFLIYLSSMDTAIYPILLLLPAYLSVRRYFRLAVSIRKKHRKRLVWEQTRNLMLLAGLFSLLYTALAFREVLGRLWQPVPAEVWCLFLIFNFFKQSFFMQVFLLCRWISGHYIPGILLVIGCCVAAARTDAPAFVFGMMEKTLFFCLIFLVTDTLLLILNLAAGKRCDFIENT